MTTSKLLLAAAFTLIALPASAADPDATITMTGARFGLGIGYVWADGVLHYRGANYPFRAEGVSVYTVGAAKIEAQGEVYGLADLGDFEGKYDVLSAGASILGGGSAAMEENDRGVKLNLHSQATGLHLNLGIESMKVEFTQLSQGN